LFRYAELAEENLPAPPDPAQEGAWHRAVRSAAPVRVGERSLSLSQRSRRVMLNRLPSARLLFSVRPALRYRR
jgi:hypothetical protein